MLGVAHGYVVSTLRVKPGSWLEGKTLREARLRDEGVVVLGIYRRRGDRIVYIGAPRPATRLLAGDELVVYGPEEAIASLATRETGPLGDREHAAMVERQRMREEAQRS